MKTKSNETKPAFILQGADSDLGRSCPLSWPESIRLSDVGYDVGVLLYRDGGLDCAGETLRRYWRSTEAAETLCSPFRMGVDLDRLGRAPWECKPHRYPKERGTVAAFEDTDGYGVWNGEDFDYDFLRKTAKEHGGVHVYLLVHGVLRDMEPHGCDMSCACWYHGYLPAKKNPESIVLRPVGFDDEGESDYTPMT